MKITYRADQAREVRFLPAADDVASRMTTADVESVVEIFQTPLTGAYNWDYTEGRGRVEKLYELGKQLNWNASTDLDWTIPFSRDEFPNNEAFNPFIGYAPYEAMTQAQKVEFGWHRLASQLSQFLHGEQGALLVASQLASCAPSFDAKLYAASQTFDEARHVEVFNQYLRRRCGMVYPINKNLKALIDKVLADERWDLKFIGMQLIIEGLALAAFGTQVRTTKDPLLKQIVELVMRDEGRHVAFGVNYLEDWIKSLPQEEIEDRAEFAYQACVIMRDRLFGMDVMAEYGFDLEAARKHILDSMVINLFRELLFERLIPNLKRVGLITDRVRPKYEALGALKYEDLAGDVLIDWGQLEKPLPTKENLAAARVAAE